MMGGAYFISAAQSIFANKLIHYLQLNVPEIDPMAVISIGATQFRGSLPASSVPGIVLSYMQSLHVVFILAIVLAGLSTIASGFAQWKKIHVRL
jgi:hypothetical protein